MNRPLYTWIIFGICLGVLLTAIGWVSVTTLELDRAQMEAARQAELEEKVRLALWRMDSCLMPLFIEESARPASAYQAFFGAEQAFTKGGTSYKAGDVLLPSPLLNYSSSNVLLHFDYVAGQAATSPEVPLGNLREVAAANYVAPERLNESEARLATLRKFLLQPAPVVAAMPNQPAATQPSGLSSTVPSSFSSQRQPPMQQPQQAAVAYPNNGYVLLNYLPSTNEFLVPNDNRQFDSQVQNSGANANQAPQIINPGINVALNAQPLAQWEASQGQGQQRYDNRAQELRNATEYNTRENFYQQAKQAIAGNIKNEIQAVAQQPAGKNSLAINSGEGLFKAVWLGDQLFLARRVFWRGQTHIQGCWLNWTNIKQTLLASARDLLPAADLRPASETERPLTSRLLAGMPVEVLPGPAPSEPLPMWSPVRNLLVIAWIGILLAGLASAVLLHGTLALSERRASFVSAVTHELRTPLTTFKMYSEMLAEGMVKDEEKQRQYLNTLCSEANRLSHLVENVLAYARLERGSARRNVEKVALRDLIRRVAPRLEQRAAHAGMELVLDAEEPALETPVHVDVSAVEQILFNLVDNACKYAAPIANEKVIHVEAFVPASNGKYAMLRVRDHGQGISAEGAHRLFKPFCKSAHEAAHTAPGVGLGLALCRRLSRSLGGDLRWVSTVKNGACFELSLPVTAQG